MNVFLFPTVFLFALQSFSLADGKNGYELPRSYTDSGLSSTTEILGRAEALLAERFDTQQQRFSLNPRWIPAQLAAVEPHRILDVQLVGHLDRYSVFQVEYDTDNRRREANVQLEVRREKRIPVLREQRLGGSYLEAEHLEWRWIEVGFSRGPILTDPDQVAGKVLRRTISPGTAIRESDLSSPYLIESGELVRLVFEQAFTRIELAATARQNGAAGDTIRLYSEDTRRTYLAEVTGSGEARWISTR